MGKQNYAISTALTGDSGEAFLQALTEAQRALITGLPDQQRSDLQEIVSTRRAIAEQLRRTLAGDVADEAKVLQLSRHYGELDGRLSYLYATAFAAIHKTLTAEQRQSLQAMRAHDPSDPPGPFLYSTPVSQPSIGSTDFLFLPLR